MRDTLTHRGPDAGETWVAPGGEVALMHRRLKVIDLDGGRQPMACSRGRYHIVYNGEVYNYRQLRAELVQRGYRFDTRSDTEVVLAAYVTWQSDCVKHLNGIFAFAVWDDHERRLFLARDHLGVKPLYYGVFDGILCVSSEARAIVSDPRVPRRVDPEALDLYFHHGYVPAPWSIWHGVHKMRAAHRLELDLGANRSGLPDQERYWEIPFGDEDGTGDALPRDEDELLAALEEVLREAVRRQTVSDVPLGAFLSGGVDSSLVVAYLAQYSDRPVKTFSVGYADREYDERPFARELAERFSTEHRELVIGAESAELLPEVADSHDEPFADAAALPTAMVSRLAREEVTVVLSGDGGDETHAGYPRYLRAEQLRGLDRMPLPLRRAGLGALARLAPSWKRRGFLEQVVRGPADRYDAITTQVPWAHRRAVYSADMLEMLRALPRDNVGDGMPRWRRDLLDRRPRARSEVDRFQYLDLASYLPEQLMVKLDRASMRVSLEARVPLLDLDAVGFAGRIPARWRMKDGRPKYLLRRLLARLMGERFASREKHGFRVPGESWFRTLPRSRLQEYLFPPGIETWLDRRRLERLLLDSPRGVEFLWTFAMFAAWYRCHGGTA